MIGAKVVTSARSPGTNCFGFVTMSTFEEATKCIENLNKTEIHGKVVTVERVSKFLKVAIHALGERGIKFGERGVKQERSLWGDRGERPPPPPISLGSANVFS